MKLFCHLKKPPMVKNLPAMRKTWVQSWVGKIHRRRERLLLQYSGLENSKDCSVHGAAKSQTRLSSLHFHFLSVI